MPDAWWGPRLAGCSANGHAGKTGGGRPGDAGQAACVRGFRWGLTGPVCGRGSHSWRLGGGDKTTSGARRTGGQPTGRGVVSAVCMVNPQLGNSRWHWRERNRGRGAKSTRRGGRQWVMPPMPPFGLAPPPGREEKRADKAAM